MKQLKKSYHARALARATWQSAFMLGLFSLVFVSLLVLSLGIVLLHHSPKSAIQKMQGVGIPEPLIASFALWDKDVLMELGYYHFGGEGEYDLTAAKRYFEAALLVAPEAPLIHFNLSRIAFLRERFNEALLLASLEERLNPTEHRLYYLRGLIYGYDKRYPEAIAAFQEFNRRKPSTWAGHVDLAWIYFQQGKYKEVKETIEIILPHQSNAWLQNSYGVALLNLGEKEKARDAFLAAQVFAANLTPAAWGAAYTGNDPASYERGLREMRQSIDANLLLTQ